MKTQTRTETRTRARSLGARRLRAAAAVGIAAVGALVLAGCMKVDLDMTLSEDDTVSGTMIMAVSNDLAETMGMDPGELWDQGEGDLGSDVPEGATQEPYSDDDYTGTKYTFTDAPLDEMSGDADDGLSITRDGDDYVVSGSMDMTDTGDLDSMPQSVRDAFDVSIAVTFPGEVSDSNGDVDGNTVTWHPEIGQANELEARGSATAGSDFPWWLVGLLVGIIVIVLVVWLVLRSRRSGSAAATPAEPYPGDAAAYGGAPSGPLPGSGTGPTADEQVFGVPPTAAIPTTGPVAQPLEPDATPTPPPPPTTDAPDGSEPTTGPVAEPFEPDSPAAPDPDETQVRDTPEGDGNDTGDDTGDDQGRRPHDPTPGA